MRSDVVHLLSGGGSLSQATIACGSREAQCAHWDTRLVTCPRCLGTCAQQPKNPETLKPPTPPGLTEKQWLQQVVDLARAQGFLAYHTFDARKSAPGYPDLTLAKPGHPLYLIELKVNQGQLSGHQQHWLKVLGQATGLQVAVWRPEDWERILDVLGG